jgi:hypothetical protein
MERKIFLAKLVTEGVDEPLLEDFADELNEVVKPTKSVEVDKHYTLKDGDTVKVLSVSKTGVVTFQGLAPVGIGHPGFAKEREPMAAFLKLIKEDFNGAVMTRAPSHTNQNVSQLTNSKNLS